MQMNVKVFSKLSTFAMAVFILAACATTRNAATSAVGTWDYEIKDTPYGNVQGQMMIDQDGDSYTGELRSSMGTAAMENIVIQDNEINATLSMDGNNLTINGTIDGDQIQGTVDAGGNGSFPMSASRAN